MSRDFLNDRRITSSNTSSVRETAGTADNPPAAATKPHGITSNFKTGKTGNSGKGAAENAKSAAAKQGKAVPVRAVKRPSGRSEESRLLQNPRVMRLFVALIL